MCKQPASKKDIYNLRLFYTRHKHTSIKTISYARFQRLKCPAPYQRELTALGAAVRWGTRPSPATGYPPASDKCLCSVRRPVRRRGSRTIPPNANQGQIPDRGQPSFHTQQYKSKETLLQARARSQSHPRRLEAVLKLRDTPIQVKLLKGTKGTFVIGWLSSPKPLLGFS